MNTIERKLISQFRDEQVANNFIRYGRLRKLLRVGECPSIRSAVLYMGTSDVLKDVGSALLTHIINSKKSAEQLELFEIEKRLLQLGHSIRRIASLRSLVNATDLPESRKRTLSVQMGGLFRDVHGYARENRYSVTVSPTDRLGLIELRLQQLMELRTLLSTRRSALRIVH